MHAERNVVNALHLERGAAARGEALVAEHRDQTMIIGYTGEDVSPRAEGSENGRAALLASRSATGS